MPTTSTTQRDEVMRERRERVREIREQVHRRLRERSERSDNKVAFGSSITVPEGEVARDVVAIGGRVDVEGDVEGDVVAVGGPVSIDGKVTGDVVAVGGERRSRRRRRGARRSDLGRRARQPRRRRRGDGPHQRGRARSQLHLGHRRRRRRSDWWDWKEHRALLAVRLRLVRIRAVADRPGGAAAPHAAGRAWWRAAPSSACAPRRSRSPWMCALVGPRGRALLRAGADRGRR